MQEIWKDIPVFDGMYQVSNLGRVKSLDRYVNHYAGGKRIIKGRIRKYSIDKRGYTGYIFSIKQKNRFISTHVLVAMSFLNHKPNGFKYVVHHKDNNKSNNNVNNLEVITMRENVYTHNKGTSKYKGVSWDKQHNKWASFIYIKNKNKYLGRFKNEYEAHIAYQKELKNLLL